MGISVIAFEVESMNVKSFCKAVASRFIYAVQAERIAGLTASVLLSAPTCANL